MNKGLIATQERLNNFFNEEVDDYLMNTRFNDNPEVTLKSVGHAILWACALDEFYKKKYPNYESLRKSDLKFEVVAGIRYARNRAVHQFTQLLYITEGAELPALLPMPFFEIRWKEVADLPVPDKGYENRELAAFYRKHLENKPVRHAFDDLREYFERMKSA
tara:strand:- start:11565 stop:12050 length:486 start_codon:yes stop_codon:yes gene_type:complete